jgi:hypothetical protein
MPVCGFALPFVAAAYRLVRLTPQVCGALNPDFFEQPHLFFMHSSVRLRPIF